MKTLFSEEQIKEAVVKISSQINEKFKDTKEDVVAICVLNGALFFYADLVRLFEFEVICDTLGISSYHKASSSGEIKWVKKPGIDLKDKHVLIVEDICDTGLSLKFLKQELEKQKPKSLYTASLIQRGEKSIVDFFGFQLDQKSFVVGYGLDYDNKYRYFKDIKEINT